MIVFKAFLKILNKNKSIIILYTVILVVFGGINMNASDTNTNFVASKPNVMIINNDEKNEITDNFIKYIKDNSKIIKLKNNEDAINDGLFYRDVNFVIYIPKGYGKDFMAGKNPEIEIKTTKDYKASLADMLITRYIQVASTYRDMGNTDTELVKNVNETLAKQGEVTITSKLDTNKLERITFYYNFASYSILACLVYVICLVLSSFKDIKIQKRTIISSTNYKKINRYLLLSNGLFSLILWSLYVILSFILLGNDMFSKQGAIYMLNCFVFTIVATTIAMFIGSIVLNKNAINGIVNVIALGSSFLCGAFVPMQWLPKGVLRVAHILPSYYYISTNEAVKSIETFDKESLKPVCINTLVLLGFALFFVILTNVYSKKKQKIG